MEHCKLRDAIIINSAELICNLNYNYCITVAGTKNTTCKPWDLLPYEEQRRFIAIVTASLENPAATPEQSHERWLHSKLADGWVFGTVADLVLKQHPNICHWDMLSPYEQFKDVIFTSIIHSTVKLLG